MSLETLDAANGVPPVSLPAIEFGTADQPIPGHQSRAASWSPTGILKGLSRFRRWVMSQPDVDVAGGLAAVDVGWNLRMRNQERCDEHHMQPDKGAQRNDIET